MRDFNSNNNNNNNNNKIKNIGIRNYGTRDTGGTTEQRRNNGATPENNTNAERRHIEQLT